MSFFTWVGIIVVSVLVLACVIPFFVGATQFWVSVYSDFKRMQLARRDKKAGVK